MTSWRVGDQALDGADLCRILAISGGCAWVQVTDLEVPPFTTLLSELKRPARLPRTVVMVEWADRHPSQPNFWLQASISGYHFGGTPTGRTHEFEVEDE